MGEDGDLVIDLGKKDDDETQDDGKGKRH